jgi:integrase
VAGGGLANLQVTGRIPEAFRAEEGRVLCLWADAGWGELVRNGKQVSGRFSDELVDATVLMVREWNPQPVPTWLTFVPSQLYRPKLAEKKRDVTVGEFIDEVKAKADVEAKTIEGYCKAFRTIVASIFKIDGGKEKFDHHKGGHEKWLARVHGVKLSTLTPVKIQEWKRAYLAKAKRDPLSQRQAKVSVNSFMRRARSLFAADILRHLAVEPPEPRPFAGVAFEPRQSLKYRSSFAVLELIKEARSDLAESDPELFKIFLLAVMVGLRRKEIDLLEWPSFKWEARVIRIEPTRHFHPKSEDSIGDVPVDSELMEIFRGYRARATGDFVIESDRKPKADVIYDYYRCQEHFEKLAKWLRKKGVKVSKPLHTLRKEYGSQINAIHGIHAASRALRHADITNEYYTDSRARVTPGMGHLLKDDKVSDSPAPGSTNEAKRKGKAS